MDSGAWHVALRQKGHPRETQKRVHKDRSSRDWGDVTTSPGTPGATRGWWSRKDPPLEASDILILNLGLGAARGSIPVVLRHVVPVCGHLCWPPQDTDRGELETLNPRGSPSVGAQALCP